jgi:hypothetical protein
MMMRRGLLLIVPVLVSCADPLGPTAEPFAVLWVEWPAAVTAAQPGTVLVTYVDDFCSTTSLDVATDFPNVTVRSTITRTGPPCPLADFAPAFPRDSLLPLPKLATPYGLPAYHSVQATLSDPFDGTPNVHTLGTIQVAAASDTTRYMAGSGTVFVDSAGCPVLVGGFGFTGPFGQSHTYAIANPPQLDSQARRALVGAHIVAAAPPAGCGTHRVVHLDYAIVSLVP